MITSTIHVLILAPVFFVLMKEQGTAARQVAAGIGGVAGVKEVTLIKEPKPFGPD